MSRGVRHEGSLCCWVQKYARRRLPKPAKDYLEHILEGWSDALRSYEKRRRTRMSEGKNSSVFMNAPTRRQLIAGRVVARSEEHTSELQSLTNLVCRLLL